MGGDGHAIHKSVKGFIACIYHIDNDHTLNGKVSCDGGGVGVYEVDICDNETGGEHCGVVKLIHTGCGGCIRVWNEPSCTPDGDESGVCAGEGG